LKRIFIVIVDIGNPRLRFTFSEKHLQFVCTSVTYLAVTSVQVYVVAPFVGSVAGALLYIYVLIATPKRRGHNLASSGRSGEGLWIWTPLCLESFTLFWRGNVFEVRAPKSFEAWLNSASPPWWLFTSL